MSKHILIERIKNIMIIALLLIMVVLLSFFWTDISLSDVVTTFENIIETENNYMPQLTEIITPREITISFGTEDYTRTDDKNLQAAFEECERAFIPYDGLMYEEITQGQYEEIMSYKSVELNFGYSIPLEGYIEKILLINPPSSIEPEQFTKLGYSAASPESMFAWDSEKNKYYRIVADKEDESIVKAEKSINDIIDNISEQGYDSYYRASTIFGGKNTTLVPLSIKNPVYTGTFIKEFDITNERVIKDIEEKFFGSGMDFVRKITENKGSLLYMYGYGQKVLKINSNGNLEYNEELTQEKYTEGAFFDALDTAIAYIASHAGWQNVISLNQSPVLRDVRRVSENEGKNKGYEFRFGLKTKGIDVYNVGQNDTLLIVTVYGSQVTEYYTNLVTIMGTDMENPIYAVSPVELITNNYEVLNNSKDLDNIDKSQKTPGTEEPQEEGPQTEGSQAEGPQAGGPQAGGPQAGGPQAEDSNANINTFDFIVNNIDHITSGYLLKEDELSQGTGTLYPCWIISMSDVKYFFDISTGAEMGVYKAN